MPNKKGTGKNGSSQKRSSKKKRRITSSNKSAPVHYSVYIISLLLSAILLAVFIYSDSSALLSGMIKTFMLSLFSVAAYLLPPALAGLSVYVSKKKDTGNFTLKLVLLLLECVLFGGIYQTAAIGAVDYSDLAYEAVYGLSGGILGGALANILINMIGRVAAAIILIFAFLGNISVIFKVSLFSLVTSFVSGLFGLREEARAIEHKDVYENGRQTAKKISSGVQGVSKKIDFTIGDDDESVKKNTKKSKTEKAENEENGNTEKGNRVVTEDDIKARIDEIIFSPPENEPEEIPEDIEIGTTLDEAEKEIDEKKPSDSGAEDGVKKQQNPPKAEAVSEEEKAQIKNDIETSIEAEVKEYVFPPISLLKKPQAASADKRREMQETANKLMEILKNFGVEARLLQVTQGPSVTRYEIQPHTGIKLSKITGLAEDIALNLAVPTVLVAAVPGKAAVGIEVPNSSVNTVSVRELLESTKFRDAASKLTVALGKDIGGNVVVGDIAKMPHVLIAGSTGSGKSVCINTIITSILYKAKPEEVKLIMVDPKVVELGVYNGIPHLLIPVVTDPKKAAGALHWAVGEMMRRYALFAETGSRNLTGYNELMAKNNEQKLPQIVIIIDELADLMMVAAKEVEDYVCRLAQLARAAGIHLIIATQRPSVDVITGLIKANVPSRIAFAVSSQVDSRTILDKGGAEKLLGKGDMLYHPTGLSNALRVQGAFVSDSEIENIVSFIKENSEVTHYSEDLSNHLDCLASGDVASEESKEDNDADELLPAAIDLAVELGQISTAMIQRRLKVGYARAGRIIDQMEERGIISGANGSKPREVYMNRINMTEYE